MAEKKNIFLILCGILCIHQILANEASDHLNRRKRVINLEPGGDLPTLNGEAPYVVNIRRTTDHINLCVGSILSRYTIITVATCVATIEQSFIQVLSSSTYFHLGVEHSVIMKNLRYGNHQGRRGEGIALLTVEPPLLSNTRSGAIQLHQGPLLAGTPVTVFGWGCNPTVPRGTIYRSRLRSITVPIMSHRDCVNSYRNRLVISRNDICTYDANKRCGHTDSGAPLVVNNQLAGLHLWGGTFSFGNAPDVFVFLQSSEYGPWIRENIIYNVVHMRGAQ